MADQKTSADNGGIGVGGNFTGIANTGVININIGYTIEEHERILKERIQKVRAKLKRKHGKEKNELELQLQVLISDYNDLHTSYQKRLVEIEVLKKELTQARIENPDISELDFKLAFEALNRGDSKLADAIFERIIKNADKVIAQTAKAYFNRGQIAYNNIEWNSALEHFKRAYNLVPSTDYLSMYAIMSQLLGNFSKATELYSELMNCTDKMKVDKPKMALHYGKIILLYLDTGRYNEAELLCERIIQIGNETPNSKDIQLAISYNICGMVYAKLGKYDLATDLCNKAIELAKVNTDTNPLHLASMYTNLGEIYQHTGRYDLLENIYLAIYKIRVNNLPEGHPDFASSFCQIGFLCIMSEQYAKAESFLIKAEEIIHTTFGLNHPELSNIYNSLGFCYYMQCRYQEAEDMYKKSIAIRTREIDQDHPDLAMTYHNLAKCYRDQNNISEANNYYKIALAIVKKKLPADHQHIKEIIESYYNFLENHKGQI